MIEMPKRPGVKARGTALRRGEHCGQCAHYSGNYRYGISQGDCVHHGHRLALEAACRRDFLDKQQEGD